VSNDTEYGTTKLNVATTFVNGGPQVTVFNFHSWICSSSLAINLRSATINTHLSNTPQKKHFRN